MERSSRGHDCQVTCELDMENQGCLVSIHPWNVHSPHHSHSQNHFKDAALRGNMLLRPSGQYAGLNPVTDADKLKILMGVCGAVLNAQPLETSLPVKSRCLAGLVPSNRQWLPHSSFPTLCVQELFSDFTWEMPEFVNQRCPNNDNQRTCKILRNKIKKKRNRDYLSKTVILWKVIKARSKKVEQFTMVLLLLSHFSRVRPCATP